MSKQFEIIQLDNEPYDFLIIAASSISPLNCLDDIIVELDKKTVNVLFDLTLINGTNSNRYITGKCVEGSFIYSSFNIVNSLDDNIKNICKSFFIENNEIVQRSVISKQLKFLLKEGMV